MSASAPLYMLKLPLDERRLYAFAAAQGLSKHGEADEGYVAHALLAALFGPAAPKPFSLQRIREQPLSLLAYAAQPSSAFEEIARLRAAPDVYQAVDWAASASKPMPARFSESQCLDFSVRVLPMVRVGRQHPVFEHGKEVDVFLVRAEADRTQPKPDRQALYRDWLADRFLKGGAELIGFDIAAHRQATLLRKKADGHRHLLPRHPDLTMVGTLVIRDPAAFRASLARGIGRHRAFGYGMVMLKPPGG